VPFVAKAMGVPLAKLAARIMAGSTLEELGFTQEIKPQHWCVKESVFPFVRFPGSTITLSPEMRSTGEVMGLDTDLGVAFAKAQAAVKPGLPTGGNVFLSVKDEDKPAAIELAQRLVAQGFKIFSTGGTAKILQENGVDATRLAKINEGRPTAVDMLKNNDIQLVINTPGGMIPRKDENTIRAVAYAHNVCLMTTLMGAQAAVRGIEAQRADDVEIGVRPIQDYVKNTSPVG
jgi:carbamoyl-phosphate synthase large subunit